MTSLWIGVSGLTVASVLTGFTACQVNRKLGLVLGILAIALVSFAAALVLRHYGLAA
jgi:hypothetical protein